LVAPEAEVEEAEVVEEDDSDVEEDAPEEEEAESDSEDEADPDDDDDEEPEDEDEDHGDYHTVSVDGETRRVTLEELKRGYSGQEFVQKGMQANANARKLVMQEARALQQAREEFFSLQQRMQETGGLVPPEPPSDDLIQTDPIGYLEAQSRYQAEVAKYRQDVEMVEHQRQLAAQQYQAQFAAQVEQQAELVKQEIPELADPEKGGSVLKDLRNKGVEYGFSEEELGSLVDSRMVRVLNDARKWRNLQASKKTASQKAEGARPVVKPGSKARPESKKKARAKQRERLRQTGRVDDAVALLFE